MITKTIAASWRYYSQARSNARTEEKVEEGTKIGKIPSFFINVHSLYLKEFQKSVGDYVSSWKQRVVVSESKFHETSMKKASIANEWLQADVKIREEIKEEEQKFNSAKLAYLTEFISYHKNVKAAKDNASGDTKDLYKIIQPLEMQKVKLDQYESKVTVSLNRLKELKSTRESSTYAEELKSIKEEHTSMSHDLFRSRNSLHELNKVLLKSQRLASSAVDVHSESSSWRRNVKVAHDFMQSVALSVQFMILSHQK